MYELYQAEWCPYSSFVREQLTERGVDFVVRQVPAAKAERTAMKERTGHDSISVLMAGARVIAEFNHILAFLEE
jgi:glutaredoxin